MYKSIFCSIIFVLVFSTTVTFGQYRRYKVQRASQNYSDSARNRALDSVRSHAASVADGYANRISSRAKFAAESKQQRQWKVYKSIVNDGLEIYQDSNSILSSERQWTYKGVEKVTGALCRVRGNKITIAYIYFEGDKKKIGTRREDIKDFSEEDVEYVEIWKRFEKLSKSKRKRWIEVIERGFVILPVMT